MTVVPVGDANAPTSLEAAARAREQRYNELLRSQPPAAAPAPAPAAPSLFHRIVAPIASALGIGAKPTPPQQQAQSATQRPVAQQPPQPDDHARTPQEERDPDSDVTPPQLRGCEFTPAQVQDGDDTIFSAIVVDDLSGVRSVSGVIASPSGAPQGFAAQREGESDRFVSKISIPKEAAEGIWTVKYLTLSDNASNSINLNAAQGQLPGSAAFRVTSSRSDSTGPALKAIWLDRPSMKAGDQNTIFVTAEDDKSGVALVSGVFISPSKQARIGFGCRAGNNPTTWECAVAPPTCLDCGTWQLEQVQLQDKANNTSTFRGDNPMVAPVHLDIAGESCDAGAPSVSSLTLDPPVVSNAESTVINVHAIVADDGCGVASLSGQAAGPAISNGARLYFSFDPSADGTNFIGHITVPKHAAKGVWTIAWIQALDKGHNLRAYAANDPVIARVTFRVE
ncbi:MAG: hypothetical protein JO197_06170 [Acidobacteria bacterium]|nr:hypothetical protein [Acidobacteriota bacterium]MBV9070645.1 hypothetical protein [Acidobacteriota bacterium]MBV9478168.1 hypothetical protein [Acidobacteriota bacterium]